jgi:hypothetical protein
MPADPKALQRLPGHGAYGSSAGIDKVFHEARYVTTDAPAVVEAAGYFNALYERLPKTTVIKSVMTAAGTPVVKQYIVTASSSTAVTIALQATT